MTRSIRSTALALLVSVLCAAAHAQAAKTREQVRNELAQAIRNGDMISGESGLTLRQQFPARYPQAAPTPGLSREQVEQELADALRGGDLMVGGELADRRSDGVPGAFPRELMVGMKTREQVRSELAEAIRTGDVLAGGEMGLLK